jgi:hypothetical protein
MRLIRLSLSATCLAAALAFGVPAAATPQRPANATAQCKDGTYSTAKTKQGACSNHGGVETWYGDSDKAEAKAHAKSAGHETKEAAKDAGKATKEGAKATAGVVKDAGKATGKAAKDVGKRTKNAGEAAADAIKTKPSDAPEKATAKCKDGTYSFATEHRGACSNHGGVAEFYR